MLLALLAAITALLSHPPMLVSLALVLLWPLLLVRQLMAGQTSDPLRSMQQTPQGWRLKLNDGQVHFAELTGPVRITRCLIAMSLRESIDLAERDLTAENPTSAPRCWRVVIWADQVNAEDWRRFSVALRWRRRPASSGNRMLSDKVLLSAG